MITFYKKQTLAELYLLREFTENSVANTLKLARNLNFRSTALTELCRLSDDLVYWFNEVENQSVDWRAQVSIDRAYVKSVAVLRKLPWLFYN